MGLDVADDQVADDQRGSLREKDAVSLVNIHQFMGRAARRRERGRTWRAGKLEGAGGLILNKAGVITAISADITPVVRQSP